MEMELSAAERDFGGSVRPHEAAVESGLVRTKGG